MICNASNLQRYFFLADKKIWNRRTCFPLFPISSSTTASPFSNIQFLIRLGFKLEYPLYNRVHPLSGNASPLSLPPPLDSPPYSVQPKVFSIRPFSLFGKRCQNGRFVRGKGGETLKWSLRRMRRTRSYLSVYPLHARVFFLYAENAISLRINKLERVITGTWMKERFT